MLLSLSPRHGSRIRRRAMRGISALNTPLSTVSTFAWPELERALSPWTDGAVVVILLLLLLLKVVGNNRDGAVVVVLLLLLLLEVVGNNRDDPQPVLRITRFPAHHWLALLRSDIYIKTQKCSWNHPKHKLEWERRYRLDASSGMASPSRALPRAVASITFCLRPHVLISADGSHSGQLVIRWPEGSDYRAPIVVCWRKSFWCFRQHHRVSPKRSANSCQRQLKEQIHREPCLFVWYSQLGWMRYGSE